MLQMVNQTFIDKGHQAILESFREKYQLEFIRIFNSATAIYAVGVIRPNKKVFLKIKGVEKNVSNEARFQRSVLSNKLAQEVKAQFIPEVIEFNSFERDNILWIASLTGYGGEPISSGRFFRGDDAAIDDNMIAFLRHVIESIEHVSSRNFYTSQKIKEIIRKTFGRRVISEANEWTSAHCDLHWGNILSGGVVIDWETFSQAPKGLDAASITLFSSNNPKVFKQVCDEFADVLLTDSGKLATLWEASRIFYKMPIRWQRHESNIRDAVMLIVNPRKIRWPERINC